MDEASSHTGVGQPEGVLNADATITVAKETGQAASTIAVREPRENVCPRASKQPAASDLCHKHCASESDGQNLINNRSFHGGER
jgi:hypothetical protein